jgi:hypothetical protein
LEERWKNMATVDHDTDSARSGEPVGELVQRASQQLSRLVRDEMRLAQAEMARKGRRFGAGGGLLAAAAVTAFLALQALVATVVAALAEALPVWAAALIVTAVLAVTAAVLAALGRAQLRRAGSPAPEQAIANVRADVAEIKERTHR